MHVSSAPAAPTTPLGPPPTGLADTSLFFDFDGTLVDLAPTPDAVVVGTSLVHALEVLAARLSGRVAVVSGRSLAQLDALLGRFAGQIAVAGSHGAERRLPDGRVAREAASASLDAAVGALAKVAAEQDLLLERKTLGAALHYRQQPEREAAAIAAATAIAKAHGVRLQHGKMMVELRADGDKGQALAALMQTPAMAGTRPLFFGDDVTDEDGFAAATEAGGAGVLVGEPRATAARFRLAGVAALHAWIDDALAGLA